MSAGYLLSSIALWLQRPGRRGSAGPPRATDSFAVVEWATYVALGVAALILLMRFGRRAWYWHASALAMASAASLSPLPDGGGRTAGFVVGAVFVFLTVWGAAAPFFPRRRAAAHKLAGAANGDPRV